MNFSKQSVRLSIEEVMEAARLLSQVYVAHNRLQLDASKGARIYTSEPSMECVYISGTRYKAVLQDTLQELTAALRKYGIKVTF